MESLTDYELKKLQKLTDQQLKALLHILNMRSDNCKSDIGEECPATAMYNYGTQFNIKDLLKVYLNGRDCEAPRIKEKCIILLSKYVELNDLSFRKR